MYYICVLVEQHRKQETGLIAHNSLSQCRRQVMGDGRDLNTIIITVIIISVIHFNYAVCWLLVEQNQRQGW